MIKRRLLTFCIGISITLSACSGTAKQSETPVLSGTISGLSGELYLIDLLQAKAGPVDTATLDENGHFSFDFAPEVKGFYRVSVNQSFAIVVPLVKGESVNVLGDINQLQDLQISGSKDAERMYQFNNFLREVNNQGQALEQEFQAYANSPKRDSIIAVFRDRYMQIEAQKVAKMKELIDADPGLFANLALMEQMPKNSAEDMAYYKKVDEALATQYSQSPFYKHFHSQYLKDSQFTVGSEVPEINLPSPQGDPIPLSSLRGKVVLIDFWASWCKPCRRENPNVVAAYQKFKDKGFTVYGVSLDRTKDAWVNAIAQDQLTWTHVSDLKFWNSEAAKDYGVSAIPFALLIDQEGKVIGKNLRGAALHQKLEEVLN
jgi:peroxiredoxin